MIDGEDTNEERDDAPDIGEQNLDLPAEHDALVEDLADIEDVAAPDDGDKLAAEHDDLLGDLSFDTPDAGPLEETRDAVKEPAPKKKTARQKRAEHDSTLRSMGSDIPGPADEAPDNLQDFFGGGGQVPPDVFGDGGGEESPQSAVQQLSNSTDRWATRVTETILALSRRMDELTSRLESERL